MSQLDAILIFRLLIVRLDQRIFARRSVVSTMLLVSCLCSGNYLSCCFLHLFVYLCNSFNYIEFKRRSRLMRAANLYVTGEIKRI